MAYYNLVRMHETIRCTPAMALGITDHPWTVAELVEAALSAPEPTPLLPIQPSLPFGMSAGRAKGTWGGDRSGLGEAKPGNPGPRRFRVIKGGERSRHEHGFDLSRQRGSADHVDTWRLARIPSPMTRWGAKGADGRDVQLTEGEHPWPARSM